MADLVASSATPKITFDPTTGTDVTLELDSTNDLLKVLFQGVGVYTVVLSETLLMLNDGTNTLSISGRTIASNGTLQLSGSGAPGVQVADDLSVADGIASGGTNAIKWETYSGNLGTTSPKVVDLGVGGKVLGAQVMLEDPTTPGRYFQVSTDLPTAPLGLTIYCVVTRNNGSNDTVSVVFPAGLNNKGYRILAQFEA